jgi:hypothetical protein
MRDRAPYGEADLKVRSCVYGKADLKVGLYVRQVTLVEFDVGINAADRPGRASDPSPTRRAAS